MTTREIEPEAFVPFECTTRATFFNNGFCLTFHLENEMIKTYDMKKLILSSTVLLFFSISIMIFQISCQKEADADTNEISATLLNKVIYTKYRSHVAEIWVCNYNGTGAAKINVILPNGVVFSDGMTPVMSPDGKKIFFSAGPPYTQGGMPTISVNGDLYSCNVDGTGCALVDSSSGGSIILGGAY